MYFSKWVFESDEQEFSLRGVESKKISSHPVVEQRFESVKVNVEWMEKAEELSVICIKVVVKEERLLSHLTHKERDDKYMT